MSVEQGEHTFDVDVLISGEELRGYTAGEDLEQGEPVAITGDYEVSGAEDGGPAIGVAVYGVVEGEEVTIAGDDCEVRIETSEAIDAGDALTPDGLGTVKQGDDTEEILAVANTGAGSGELVEAYISAATGVEA